MRTSETYLAPTDSRRVTSAVGIRDVNPYEHTGIDIAPLIPNVKGDPLYAIADGVVVRNGLTSSDVSRLEIKLPNGDTAVYMHGEFSDLKKDDVVKAGQVIGTMSNIGSEKTGVHLHFEIRRNGVYVNTAAAALNPLDFLPKSYYLD